MVTELQTLKTSTIPIINSYNQTVNRWTTLHSSLTNYSCT